MPTPEELQSGLDQIREMQKVTDGLQASGHSAVGVYISVLALNFCAQNGTADEWLASREKLRSISLTLPSCVLNFVSRSQEHQHNVLVFSRMSMGQATFVIATKPGQPEGLGAA